MLFSSKQATLINCFSFIFAILLFCLAAPFYFWDKTFVLPFFQILCIIICFRFSKINNKGLVFFCIWQVVYLYVSLKCNATLIGTIVMMYFGSLLLVEKQFLKEVFDKYVVLFSLTLIPSIVVFILILFFNADFSSKIIEPYNPLKSYNYIQFPFLVVENLSNTLTLPRFMGYYDEPGVIGTISAVVLLSRRFKINLINIPIFIAGLLSFSLTFYITLFFYILVFLRVKYSLFCLCIAIVSVFIFSENTFFKIYILDRVEIVDGGIVGNNRASSSVDSFMREYRGSGEYFFGYGDNKSLIVNSGGASYVDLIIDYGIIGTFVYVGLLLMSAMVNIGVNKLFFVYVFLLFLVVYQRPFITNYFYFFLMYAPIIYLKVTKYD